MATYIKTIKDSNEDLILPRTSATAVSYDNTESGLTATSIQSAVDEVVEELNSLELTASNVSYDNSVSGLSADTVQEGIDELQSEKAPIASPTFTGDVTLPYDTIYNGSLLDVQLDSKLNLSGGTLTGVVTANSNTSYTTRQVRNIIVSTEDAILEDMQNGDIWIKV